MNLPISIKKVNLNKGYVVIALFPRRNLLLPEVSNKRLLFKYNVNEIKKAWEFYLIPQTQKIIMKLSSRPQSAASDSLENQY